MTTELAQIRNIGMIAHIDARKPTTTTRMLFDSGCTHALDDVDEGTTVTDWWVQERERDITIKAAAITTRWRDTLIGHPNHLIQLTFSLSSGIMCARSQVILYFLHTLCKMAASPNHDQLYQFAEMQAGYFTATQARTAGFSHALLAYHVQAGLFERVCPGVYRLKRFPASPHEDLFVAWLRAGDHAVISHDSALALYALSDLLPNAIHLTVPRTASRRHPGLRLHTNQLEPADVTDYAGLPVTTASRTIADVAASGLSEELVWQAIQEALRRGLATSDQLHMMTSRRGGRAKMLIAQALAERNSR